MQILFCNDCKKSEGFTSMGNRVTQTISVNKYSSPLDILDEDEIKGPETYECGECNSINVSWAEEPEEGASKAASDLWYMGVNK